MEELLSSWWGTFAILAAGLAVVVGFVKGVESIKEWIAARARDKVSRDNMESRIMQAIDDLDKSVRATDASQLARIDDLIKRTERIEATLVDVQEQSSALTYDKLMSAYSKHGVNHEPIGVAALASIQHIYEAYIKGGRNHIPTDFTERLNSCPIEK